MKDRFPSKAAEAEAALAASAAVAAAGETAAPQVDATEQLHKLASLRDAGILTEEEFSTKKAELLARL